MLAFDHGLGGAEISDSPCDNVEESTEDMGKILDLVGLIASCLELSNNRDNDVILDILSVNSLAKL